MATPNPNMTDTDIRAFTIDGADGHQAVDRPHTRPRLRRGRSQSRPRTWRHLRPDRGQRRFSRRASGTWTRTGTARRQA